MAASAALREDQIPNGFHHISIRVPHISRMKETYSTRASGSVHQLYAHLVFVIKRRRDLIDEPVLAAMRQVFAEECAKLGCRLISCNSDKNHVHLLLQFAPAVALAKLVNQMKGVASHRINRMFLAERKAAGLAEGEPLWSPSYFVKSVGSNEGSVRITHKYIAKQNKAPKAAAA